MILEEKNKKVFSGLLKGILIFFAVVAVLYGSLIFIIICQPHYTRFTKNRIAKMEDRFSITITENIKLREYRQIVLIQSDYRLYLDTNDLEKFMEKNVKGEIIKRNSDSMDFMYRGMDGQEVFAEVCKTDSKESYSITLSISS